MTRGEEERLGILETKVEMIQADVTQIKSDVRTLVDTQTTLALNLATRQAVEDTRHSARAATGIWVRSIVPWILTSVSLTLGVVALLNGLRI